jgi:hypothetical protein
VHAQEGLAVRGAPPAHRRAGVRGLLKKEVYNIGIAWQGRIVVKLLHSLIPGTRKDHTALIHELLVENLTRNRKRASILRMMSSRGRYPTPIGSSSVLIATDLTTAGARVQT